MIIRLCLWIRMQFRSQESALYPRSPSICTKAQIRRANHIRHITFNTSLTSSCHNRIGLINPSVKATGMRIRFSTSHNPLNWQRRLPHTDFNTLYKLNWTICRDSITSSRIVLSSACWKVFCSCSMLSDITLLTRLLKTTLLIIPLFYCEAFRPYLPLIVRLCLWYTSRLGWGYLKYPFQNFVGEQDLGTQSFVSLGFIEVSLLWSSLLEPQSSTAELLTCKVAATKVCVCVNYLDMYAAVSIGPQHAVMICSKSELWSCDDAD